MPSVSYERKKESSRAQQADMAREGRDIGGIPPVVNQVRRDQAGGDFRFFCESYFPLTFGLGWSADHLKAIAKIEQAVLRGGLFALAMPRGSGKTTLSECACMWAILNGYRQFVVLIGSDEESAKNMLESIKVEFETNEELQGDYPEALSPIVALERISQRAKGQLCEGRPTRLGWTTDEVILPDVAGSRAACAIIRVAGITGRIRGMKHKRSDGQTVRPDLVIPDDPQTDESARSRTQCITREAILAGAILGLAGPGKKISGIMPCTVIRTGDMADSILDRMKHPEWNGERTKMVYAFPKNEKLWEEYAELRAESLRMHGDIRLATEFYAANRVAMDEGAVVAWAARFNHDELSAIQHAMNLRYQDEAAFFAEYQNEPLEEDKAEETEVKADEIAAKLNRMKRGEVPIGASRLTMFIDVQQALLFYVVVAWEDDFTGCVIDCGAWPDQQRSYFTLRDIQHTLALATGIGSLEGSIYAGLERLTGDYLSRDWSRADGALLRIERCLIDANWGPSTDTVYQFCKQSPHAGIVLPSHGVGVEAAGVPFNEYKKKKGDRVGHNWRLPNLQGKRVTRYVLYDTNYWKTFLSGRLRSPMGERGCLSLFGTKPEQHRMLAEHLTSERSIKTEGRGRTVYAWRERPGRDNHWWDCLVGNAVAASMQGVTLPNVGGSTSIVPKKKVSFAEMQQRRHRR